MVIREPFHGELSGRVMVFDDHCLLCALGIDDLMRDPRVLDESFARMETAYAGVIGKLDGKPREHGAPHVQAVRVGGTTCPGSRVIFTINPLWSFLMISRP